jgi:hypothetical protein
MGEAHSVFCAFRKMSNPVARVRARERFQEGT